MKKTLPGLLIVFILGILIGFVSYFSLTRYNITPPVSVQKTSPDPTEPVHASSLTDISQTVIFTIKDRDWVKLSDFINPLKGVRFTPYANINLQKNIIFTKDEIKHISNNTTKYHWGDYDGSGFPINMTFTEYYGKFVYDKDFANTKQVSMNNTIGHGNSLNNISTVYPDASYVEYYIPGSEKTAGMDWASLRLVFEKYEENWFLVGVVHDQWTI